MTRTAPTAGLGLVCPTAFFASFKAARINRSSRCELAIKRRIVVPTCSGKTFRKQERNGPVTANPAREPQGHQQCRPVRCSYPLLSPPTLNFGVQAPGDRTRASRRRPRASTVSMASMTTRFDIFEAPRLRSVKTMGTSSSLQPARQPKKCNSS